MVRLPDRGGDIVMALIMVRPAVSRVARTTTSHAPLLDGSVGAGVTHFGFDLCTKVYFLLPCTSKSCGAHTHEPAQAIVAEPWCARNDTNETAAIVKRNEDVIILNPHRETSGCITSMC